MFPNIAVILTDPGKRIIWVNDDFTNITGYQLNEVIGKKPSILQGPKTEPEVIQRIQEGLTAQISLKEQITNYRKDGEQYNCTLVIHPIFDDSQKLTNFIAFEVDSDRTENIDSIPLLQLESKYSSSSLKGTEEMALYTKLKTLIESQQLYLNANLTLKSVADQLDTNTKYLSQVVNRCAGCNFQSFINNYRVEEAKKKITSGAYENLTLYGIGLQCGFKNKSTFYKVFKELTQFTPKDYINNHAVDVP